MKINVAGVLVDNVSIEETISQIDSFARSDQYHYIVTPYSEIVVFAQDNPKYLNALNNASLSLPDGIGVLWAAKYLNSNSTLLGSLLGILFNPKSAYKVIHHRVIGSKLVWDIAKLAVDKNYSLALVGGDDSVAAQAAYELKKQYPDLKINLALSGKPFDQKSSEEINDSSSDILLIAYSPPKQELWLYENREKLNVKVAIGLGGTFDYIAGKHAPAPQIWHQMGLEWLWRLVTQPKRIVRIWNAVPVFIWKIFLSKHAAKS